MLQDYIADEPEIGQYLHGAMQFPPSHLDPPVWEPTEGKWKPLCATPGRGDIVATPPRWGTGTICWVVRACMCLHVYREVEQEIER